MHKKEDLTLEILEKLINHIFPTQFSETENEETTHETNTSKQYKNTETAQTKKVRGNIFRKVNNQKKQPITLNQLPTKKEEPETLPTKNYILEITINNKIKKRFFLKEPLEFYIDDILHTFEINTATILKEKITEAISSINNDDEKIYNSNFTLFNSEYEVKLYVTKKNNIQLVSTFLTQNLKTS